MNLHDRSQCTLDIETISATVSDGFAGLDPLIHIDPPWFTGEEMVWGSAVSCFTERVPKIVVDWIQLLEILGGVPSMKKLETSGPTLFSPLRWTSWVERQSPLNIL